MAKRTHRHEDGLAVDLRPQIMRLCVELSGPLCDCPGPVTLEGMMRHRDKKGNEAGEGTMTGFEGRPFDVGEVTGHYIVYCGRCRRQSKVAFWQTTPVVLGFGQARAQLEREQQDLQRRLVEIDAQLEKLGG